jgi:DNA-binding response OmpR family regulator
MRILFVDNHPEFTSLVSQSFLAAHEVTIVPTILAARAAVQAARFDIALVDYDLDDGKGVELVRWVRESGITLRMVAVSARDEGNLALTSAGADTMCAKLDFAHIQRVIDETLRGQT